MSKIERFSTGYYLVDGAEPVKWPKGRVAVPHDMDERFRRYVRRPILKLGNEHYEAHPEFGVPADTVAIPDDSNYADGDEILLATRSNARGLIMDG